MRVALGSIDVSDEMRRAISSWLGQQRLATSTEVRDLCRGLLDADLEGIAGDGYSDE